MLRRPVESAVIKENPERKPVACAPCALGCRCSLAVCCRIASPRHVAHDSGSSLAGLGQRDRRTCPKRDAPFVAVERELAEISSATALRHANGKSALLVIENQSVLAAVVSSQFGNLPLCQLHVLPWSGPQQVRADPQRTPLGCALRQPVA